MKNLTVISFAAITLIACFVGVSLAGHYYHGSSIEMSSMSDMDGNQDSKITFEEFSAPQMENLRIAFNMLDTNKDGVIDSNEWDVFLEIHGYNDRSKS